MCEEDCEGNIENIQATVGGERVLADFYLNASTTHLQALISPENTRRLLLLRSDGSFAGLQCPGCGYGPMWNDHCSELITHHDQESENGGTISNACPQCGLLVHDVGLMDRWTGV